MDQFALQKQILRNRLLNHEAQNVSNLFQLTGLVFRTEEAADALEKGDYETFGRLMVASHTSLRFYKQFIRVKI